MAKPTFVEHEPQQIPAQSQQQFGELTLAFTTAYNYRWNDRGSGASQDGNFWHPVPPVGFYALGSIGIGSNGIDPNGRFASICVKASQGQWSKPPLMAPVRYERIWQDSGSGADDDGSCWRPIAPDGYVALGDVFMPGHNQAPSAEDVMCVAVELTWEGVIGGQIYADNGSGADEDLGTWQIDASQQFLETPDGIFAVNSFVARQSHTKPESSPVAHNLKLPLPTETMAEPTPPSLNDRSRPPTETNLMVDRKVIVPLTCINDSSKTITWRVENSPFYTVERLVDYRLLLFCDNKSKTSQEVSSAVTTGISEETSETFSVETGIKVSMESGVQAGAFSSKTSVELSISLGYSQSTSVTEFRSETDEATLSTPPDTSAALWGQQQEFRVRRMDNTLLGPGLLFEPTDSAYVVDQFPKPVNATASDGGLTSLKRWRRSLK